MSETAYPERYTLEMAARIISEQTGEKEKDIQSLLIAAVQEGKLPVYKPGSDVCYKPSTVREFYEEAFWYDLNIWMDEFLPRIKWRFPGGETGELGNLTMAAAIGAEPDYHEYLALEKSILLTDVINYALGVPPEAEDRNAFSDHRGKDYTLLLKRAMSAIHSGTLKAIKRDGEYRISKKEFRLWVEHQGVHLSPRYEELEPLENLSQQLHKTSNLQTLKKKEQRAKRISEVANETFEDPLNIPYGGKTKLCDFLCSEESKLFTSESTFNEGWKEAKKSGLIEIENVEQYKGGK